MNTEGEVHTKCWYGNLNGRPHGKPRIRWEDNIKRDLQGNGWGHGV